MKKELNEKDVLTMADIGMELQHGHISIIEARDRKYIKQSRLREAVEGLEASIDYSPKNKIEGMHEYIPVSEAIRLIDEYLGGALKEEKSKEKPE